MSLNKKQAALTLALTVGLTYTSAIPAITYAKTSLDSINNQKASSQSLQAKLSAQQKKVQGDLNEINKKQLALTGEISQGQADINQNNDQIAALTDEIGTISKRIQVRKAVLNQRLVSIYKNGTTGYLDVLFGAKSFSDLVTTVKALNMITTQDHKLLTDQINDKKAVATKKKTVERKQASNVAHLEKLRNNLSDVETLQAQKKIAATALSTQQSSVSARLTALSQAAASLSNAQPTQTKGSDASSQASIAAAHVTAASYKPAANNTSHSSSASSGQSSSSASSQPAGISASVANGGVSGILNFGNRFIGNSKYVWGASDPAGHQFDCSGFVRAAFAAGGIGVGGTTSALVNEGSAVSISQAKPGDLVFFNTYKQNGHVGIYLGGGRFIGSQSSTGVAIASMSNPYWSAHFGGVVRRILN